MPGYILKIHREALGPSPDEGEMVYALADDESAAQDLVRTALRLNDERIEVVRLLNEREIATIDIKPYQVRHAT